MQLVGTKLSRFSAAGWDWVWRIVCHEPRQEGVFKKRGGVEASDFVDDGLLMAQLVEKVLSHKETGFVVGNTGVR